MKAIHLYKKIFFLGILILLGACSEEAALKKSQLDVSNPPMTPLDYWIETNFVIPYNIRVIYKWDQNTADPTRALYPPRPEQVKPALEALLNIWIKNYNKFGGPDFIKKIAPKEIVLIGGPNLDTQNNEVVGQAEAGQRITLFNTNSYKINNPLNQMIFMGVIHHEYTHILNQHKPYDRKKFSQITPKGYTSTWYNNTGQSARQLGFISPYAMSSVDEDFAETVAHMFFASDKWTKEHFFAELKNPEETFNLILQKQSLAVEYFKEAYNIDLNLLRIEMLKNSPTDPE